MRILPSASCTKSVWVNDMKYLIRDVTAIIQEPSLHVEKHTDVLISDTRIEKIEPHIADAEAEVISGAGMLCLPGFVDAHRHNFEALIRQTGIDWNHAQYFEGVKKIMGNCFTPEDTYVSSYIGALECLNAGITTVYDWFHNNNSPEHADAAIAGLSATGIRAVFGCSDDAEGEIPVSDKPMNYADMRRIARQYFQSKDQRMTLSLASRGPQFVTMPRVLEELELAKELDVFVSMHVGDGAWGRSFPVKKLHDLHQLNENFLFVHCNTLHDEEYDIIGELGAKYVFCPEVELNMGHGFPAALPLMRRGIKPALGIDVVTSIPGDMFASMRAALAGIRAIVNDKALHDGIEVDPLPVLASDVLNFATINGAYACGLGGVTGSLKAGMKADIILINTDSLNLLPYNNPISAVVEASHIGNVDTVIVDGNIKKRHGRMTGLNMKDVYRRANEARDLLFARAGVPTDGTWIPDVLYQSVSQS